MNCHAMWPERQALSERIVTACGMDSCGIKGGIQRARSHAPERPLLQISRRKALGNGAIVDPQYHQNGWPTYIRGGHSLMSLEVAGYLLDYDYSRANVSEPADYPVANSALIGGSHSHCSVRPASKGGSTCTTKLSQCCLLSSGYRR